MLLRLTIFNFLIAVISARDFLSYLQTIKLFTLQVAEDNASIYPGLTSPQKYYDYIIVGAGSAGCVLARRLAEMRSKKILLIEAGGEENLIMDIPAYAPQLQRTEIDWNYTTVPSENYCLASKNGGCYWPRGKVMGGTSVLNFMIYTRGHKEDYNGWERMGNPGWGWEDVKPYFYKLEDNHVENSTTNGLLPVHYSRFRSYVAKRWLKAVGQAGIELDNYNRPQQSSGDYLQVNQINGMRDSSNRAYIRTAREYTNLSILKNAMVTKVLFNKNKQAYAVKVVKNGFVYKVKARQEIILSAGTINSAKLLMLSGIGPKKHLEDLGINVLSDLSVGRNLMDHMSVPIEFHTNVTEENFKYPESFNDKNVMKYVTSRQGILASPGGCEAIAFIRTKETTDPRPDIELMFRYSPFYSAIPYKKWTSRLKGVFPTAEPRSTFTIFPLLMVPKSRGWMLLNSTDPMDKPLIYPNYFSDHQDIRSIIAGIREAVRVTEQPALQKIGVKLFEDPRSPCAQAFEFNSDIYWECMIRTFTITIYHISGTCKMGPDSDPDAVVDHTLRVKGVSNLRVVDASIMPEIMTGHTNAPVYMIAEKAADMIKKGM